MSNELNIVLCEHCNRICSTDFTPENGVEYVCATCLDGWLSNRQGSNDVTLQDMEEYVKSSSLPVS